MKTFIASVEERYVWNCPYCNELCSELFDDPEEEDQVQCEHCGEWSKCKRTDR